MKIEKTRSADGTTIAFETTGHGPPLVLVGGAFCDRTARASGTPLAALLADRFTVLSYDRRGRGDSGDTSPYAVEREVEDLSAVIATAGGSAFVFGNSSGGLLALDAAARGASIARLASYEPPVVLDPERLAAFEAIRRQLADAAAHDRRAEAVELFLTRVMQLPATAFAGIRQSPMFPSLAALAHTPHYDLAITCRGPARLAEAATVRCPALVLTGAAGAPWMRDAIATLAGAIPDARVRTLGGQTHDVDVPTLAAALADFFGERSAVAPQAAPAVSAVR